jgi:L-threonylcarbamoyladenylate synthase
VATLRLKAEGVGGEASVARAAEILRGGGTVAFPTETVYGLGANALSAEAVAKIFEAKERPGWDPLIVHVSDREMLGRVAALSGGTQARTVEALTAAFWPGPLTLLLPRTQEVPDAVTAGRELVGVRMPAHPVARELITLAGVPVAAPSANRFGRTSPTTAAHVLTDLDGRIDAVLDGGPTRVGLESTVLDVGTMRIYRPGAVTAAEIAQVTGKEPVAVAGPSMNQTAEEGRISPGLELRHYAPRARLVLVSGQAELVSEASKHAAEDVGVMLPDDWRAGGAGAVFRWGPWDKAEILARLLFFGLRLLDERGVKVIVCPVPEMGGLGDAIRDRLRKGARG